MLEHPIHEGSLYTSFFFDPATVWVYFQAALNKPVLVTGIAMVAPAPDRMYWIAAVWTKVFLVFVCAFPLIVYIVMLTIVFSFYPYAVNVFARGQSAKFFIVQFYTFACKILSCTSCSVFFCQPVTGFFVFVDII